MWATPLSLSHVYDYLILLFTINLKSAPHLQRISLYYRVSQKTWEFSDEFDIVFNIMSARVYFMKRVKDCKDVSIMSPKNEQ